MPKPEFPTKSEVLMRLCDRIRITVDEAVAEAKLPTQPMMRFFGPPVTSQQILMRLAYDRSIINEVMALMPEPDGDPIRGARDTRKYVPEAGAK